MIVETTRFGTVEVNDQSVLDMPDGMIGIERCKRFVLLEERPGTAFKWLQSVDDPRIAFVVINPVDFFPDYDIDIPDDQAASLGLKNSSDAAMLTTVTIYPDAGKVTANLVGPIVMNTRTLRAAQVVLSDDRYCTGHVIGAKESVESSPELAKAA